jgi:HD-GYP domain-containing protein (c-di-GMP phosphodiesterase class II)
MVDLYCHDHERDFLKRDMQEPLTETNLMPAWVDGAIETWVRLLDSWIAETDGHTLRVAMMTQALGSSMGISSEEMLNVRRGALLHDIGKLGIPQTILLKPGALTKEEWDVMRRHPVYAHELIAPIQPLAAVTDIPYCHHENWDGSGYPRGLRGEAIPLAARIFAVADVWDALRADRPYRNGWADEAVYDYIQKQSGKMFDPHVAAAFFEYQKVLIKK